MTRDRLLNAGEVLCRVVPKFGTINLLTVLGHEGFKIVNFGPAKGHGIENQRKLIGGFYGFHQGLVISCTGGPNAFKIFKKRYLPAPYGICGCTFDAFGDFRYPIFPYF